MKTIIALLITLAAGSAFATASMDCRIDDENLKMEYGGILSRGIPSMPFQSYGSLEFVDSSLAEYNRPNFTDLMQYWDQGLELRMLFYYEPATETHSTVQLTVHAKNDGESEFTRGTYKLDIYRWTEAEEGPVHYEGEIVCQEG